MIRLEEMAKIWQEHVRPYHRLIRWKLQPEDSRMFEGFCRLESSPHGFLDNLFVFFYTPFGSAENYSLDLMQHWLKEYEDNEAQRKVLAAKGVGGDWDTVEFWRAVQSNSYSACDKLLPALMDSYRRWLNIPKDDQEFVLALLPKDMQSPDEYIIWLRNWMGQSLPENLHVLLFDHVDGNYWGEIFDQFPEQSCTLEYDLRMQEAIREIATAGEATDPYAAFRKCLFEMGEAAAKKDPMRLHEWGSKALETGKKQGDMTLLATAYITYAGMLFNFEEHDKIDSLLSEGMRLCRKELEQGNEHMKPLLLQYYAYRGAHCQIRKQRKEALDWFMKMGDEAVRFDLYVQAISAYYKTYLFGDEKGFEEDKNKAMVKSMRLTDKITEAETQISEYPFLALAFVKKCEQMESPLLYELEFEDLKPDIGKLRAVSEGRMSAIYGSAWREVVEGMQEHYTRSKQNNTQIMNKA